MEFELVKDESEQASSSSLTNNPVVLYQMANSLYEDISNPNNEYKAFELYSRASNLEYAPAQNMLGALYETGYGVDYDPLKAAYWYKKAINQGSDSAMVNLARLKTQGDIEEDYDGAKKLLERAAGMQNPHARELLEHLEENKPWNSIQKIATTLIILSIIPWTMFASSLILPILASIGLESVRIGFLVIIALAPAVLLLNLTHTRFGD